MLGLVISAVLLADPSAPPLVPVTDDVAPPLVEAAPLPRAAKKEAHQRRSVALIASGPALFALAYGVSVVAATSERTIPFSMQVRNLWPLYIPLVGPVIAGFTVNTRSSLVITALVIDGLAQLGSVALLIAGLAIPDDELRKQKPKPTVWLAPSLAPGFAGATFGLRF